MKKNIGLEAILRALSYHPDSRVTPQLMFDEDPGANGLIQVL